MAASWGQYASSALIIFQAFLCLHLYLNQIAIVARFDALEPNMILSRGRREIGSIEGDGNWLNERNSTNDYITTTEATVPVTQTKKKHHRKNHRVQVDKQHGNIESFTLKTPRTKSAHSRAKTFSGDSVEVNTRVALFREETPAISAEVIQPPLPAIHFVSDTSNYTRERHHHYAGNGRIKISGIYFDWKPAEWTHTLGTIHHFKMDKGKVSVSKAGLYLLYAQIHYANVQEVNCFRAMQNEVTVAQCCSTTSHPDRHEVKANTCSLLTTVYLTPQDSLWLTDVHERYVILTPEKSYFGLVQLYSPPATIP